MFWVFWFWMHMIRYISAVIRCILMISLSKGLISGSLIMFPNYLIYGVGARFRSVQHLWSYNLMVLIRLLYIIIIIIYYNKAYTYSGVHTFWKASPSNRKWKRKKPAFCVIQDPHIYNYSVWKRGTVCYMRATPLNHCYILMFLCGSVFSYV